MKYAIRHDMTDLDRVKTAIDKAYDAYAERLADYSPSLRWNGDRAATVSFTVMNKTLDTDLTITDDELRLQGKVPLLFRPFEGKMTKALGEEVEKWLAKARAGRI